MFNFYSKKNRRIITIVIVVILVLAASDDSGISVTVIRFLREVVFLE